VAKIVKKITFKKTLKFVSLTKNEIKNIVLSTFLCLTFKKKYIFAAQFKSQTKKVCEAIQNNFLLQFVPQ